MSSLLGMCAVAGAVSRASALGQTRPVRLDFTDAQVVSRWEPTHDVGRIEAAPAGMQVAITGSDPYIMGPPLDPPPGVTLWLKLRIRSDVAGTLQVFYFRQAPTEERSARAPMAGGKWVDLVMPLPPLERGTRLRIDPPGTEGTCTVAWLELSERRLFPKPAWATPEAPPRSGVLRVRSGPLLLEHDTRRPARYAISIDGYLTASSWSRIPVAYEVAGKPRWFDLGKAARASIRRVGTGLQMTASATDPDGARWSVSQTFSPAKRPGGIETSVIVSVNRPRTVYFLPMLALFPGHGSFGSAREHGLFAGLEYLDPPDRSSSEDDLTGEQAKRLVPDQVKITFPLMAMQAKRRYVGLIWHPQQWFAAAYDTPDRSFGSRANAMALLFPGSDGVNRPEGSLLPYSGRLLEAGFRLKASATIVGGIGDSILPAVQRYVTDRGLPPTPRTGLTRAAYARWAAGGWLDSQIRDGARFRHAYWPGFTGFAPSVAADAAMWMTWLAAECSDEALASRLRALTAEVLDLTDPAARNQSSVSHVTYPAPALLFGDASASAERARQAASQTLGRFAADGTIRYTASGGTDFGKTHFEQHANGMTAPVVWSLLANALYAGDEDLIAKGIEMLRALDRYVNTAPRGAQTWEVPLHTPDILASAYMVKAYLLGFEITGETRFLNMARHWAWSGVPFVYLKPPTTEPVGLYATTPVFGATNWVAPNWMGLPVQWCGLVYSDALYRLARYDAVGPWRKLADGIAASGVQQSWPASDRDLQGLLPDSFALRSQTRNAVAINPGTVQANAIRLFGGPEVYDYHRFRKVRVSVHAPAALSGCSEGPGQVAFAVEGWRAEPYYVLVNGIPSTPTVTVDGVRRQLDGGSGYDAETRRLVLKLSGLAKVTVAW